MVVPRGRSHKQDPDRIRLDQLRKELPIGIYGSFYETREPDLLRLKDFLRRSGYETTRTSRDLDSRSPEERLSPDPSYDLDLSKRLMDLSEVHILVFAMAIENEPSNLIQSASMELQRLTDIIEFGIKKDQEVLLLVQKGLRDNIEGSGGGVFKGLLEEKIGIFDICDFEQIDETLLRAYWFCCRCAEKRWN